MKTALAILLLSSTSAFAADECYQSPKGWTFTVIDRSVDPELSGAVWKRGNKTIQLDFIGAGTNTDEVVLVDRNGDGAFYRYEFDSNRYIIDHVSYVHGCKA